MEETRDDVILEKNYTNRDTLKKDLVKYMLNIWNKGTVEIVMNELEKEVKRKFVEDIAEAMIEDAEVSDYARCIWDEYTFDCEEQDDKCSWGCMNQNKINVLDTGVIMETVISQISDEDSIFYKYTYRYSLPKEDDYQTIDVKRFKEVLHEILNDMNIQIKPTLYQQAYPVFWLEALNMQFSRKRKKQVCFKQPIEQESDKEKYLFALLLEKRAKNTVRNNIFSGVKRELSKYLNSNLDLDESWNRWIYIKMFRDKMGSDVEKTKQKREKSFKEQLEKKSKGDETKSRSYNYTTRENKPLFKNNIVTLRELISIGRENGLNDINKPVFIFLLERLTGWMEFYNYVRMEEGIGGGYRKWIFQESCLDVLKKLSDENNELNINS